MKKSGKPLTREQALVQMADLCARSEQSEFDIERKLRMRGLPSAEIESVLTELKRRNFLNAERYAGSFARDKVKFARWGKMKIRAALMGKRVQSYVIAEALSSIDDDEYFEAALHLAQTKSKSLDLSEYDDRIRLLRHLASRGFESETAKKAIRTLIS